MINITGSALAAARVLLFQGIHYFDHDIQKAGPLNYTMPELSTFTKLRMRELQLRLRSKLIAMRGSIKETGVLIT